ncbi:MAG: glycosyltransferase, partial [Gammaproteobacteria bacterium]|nr:glycosyltransferase [Gammaproteobacteria bacterium]
PELGQRLSDGKTNVLFVGRVSPNKGHVHLMNTVLYYRMLFDDNIRLVIAGHVSPHLTKYYAHLLRMARSLGISKNVEFWGKVTTRQLASLYRESDAYLLLSEHEGFCVPILEAQSQGLPVIAYDS